MARLDVWKLDQEVTLENIEKNSSSERILKYEGFPNLRLVENLLKFMIHPWKTHLEFFLELNQQCGFLERVFWEGKA